jgi:hypothetical protein
MPTADANRKVASSTDLPAIWRARADDLRRYGAEGPARTLETVAQELEDSLESQSERLLTVTEAATLAGRHRDTIGTAISDGRLANRGTKNRPLVRSGELIERFPRRAVVQQHNSTYDAGTDARALLSTRRGR